MAGYPQQRYTGPPQQQQYGAGYQQHGGGYQQQPPAGYSQQPGGYPTQQPPGGYPSSGYPPQQSGYPGQQPGYPPTGAPHGQPPGCPPGMDPSVYSWFIAVDADRSGSISATELQQALTNGNWSHFNPETCRLMIGMFDRDNNGTIDVNEFNQLWQYLNQWKGVFDRYDRDKSGNIDQQELHTAFNEMGFRVSMNFCSLVVARFDRQARSGLKLDDFIQSCVMLRCLTDAFRVRDQNLNGIITVSYEDFMTMAITNKP